MKTFWIAIQGHVKYQNIFLWMDSINILYIILTFVSCRFPIYLSFLRIHIQTKWMHLISTSSLVIFCCVRENALWIMPKLCQPQFCALSWIKKPLSMWLLCDNEEGFPSKCMQLTYNEMDKQTWKPTIEKHVMFNFL